MICIKYIFFKFKLSLMKPSETKKKLLMNKCNL